MRSPPGLASRILENPGISNGDRPEPGKTRDRQIAMERLETAFRISNTRLAECRALLRKEDFDAERYSLDAMD